MSNQKDLSLDLSASLPVVQRSFDGDPIPTMNARDLHRFLEVETRFNDWFDRRVAEYGFEEGESFYSEVSKSSGGRPSKEYALTLDMAKELCMVENNAKGRQARRYFIACEKKLRSATPKSADVLDRLGVLIAAEREILAGRAKIEALTGENAALKPRAMYADLLADSKGDWVPMQFAKAASTVTGIGPKKILKRLRDAGVFYYLGKRLTPFQPYVDRDECRIIDELCADGKTRPQTVITPAGRQALFRLLTGGEQLALPGAAQ